jgi:cis-3-alkyl-4-acyloxetan-2-one decarboxylase
MHYIDEGPAVGRPDEARECLLFVHGNPTWSFHWRRLVLDLRSQYRCIAVDHLGCGLSDKPQRYFTLDDHIENLSAFIGRLGLDDVTLVAQDWGGAIGLGAMLREPARLRRIVLFNTGAFPPRFIPWRIRACRWPFVGRLAVQGGNVFSRAALRMALARRARLDPAVAAGYLAPYDSWSHRRAVYGFVKDIPSDDTDPTWRTLAGIESRLSTFADRRALLVWGMRDWCFGADCLERLIKAWPQAKVDRLVDAGHWVVEDAAEESIKLIQSFLQKTKANHRDNAKDKESVV